MKAMNLVHDTYILMMFKCSNKFKIKLIFASKIITNTNTYRKVVILHFKILELFLKRDS